MADISAERARLVELTEKSRTSLASLSAMLGRNSSYLQQFVRKGSPRKLEEADRRKLAQFFGVDEVELGADAGAARPRGLDEYVAVPRLPLESTRSSSRHSLKSVNPQLIHQPWHATSDNSLIPMKNQHWTFRH